MCRVKGREGRTREGTRRDRERRERNIMVRTGKEGKIRVEKEKGKVVESRGGMEWNGTKRERKGSE